MMHATYAIRRNQNLYRQRTRVQLGPISVGFVTIAVICALALLYLNQITKTSVYGYKLRDLQNQQQQLVSSKQELEVEAARLQSVQNIQKSTVVSKMVPEGAANYVSN